MRHGTTCTTRRQAASHCYASGPQTNTYTTEYAPCDAVPVVLMTSASQSHPQLNLGQNLKNPSFGPSQPTPEATAAMPAQRKHCQHGSAGCTWCKHVTQKATHAVAQQSAHPAHPPPHPSKAARNRQCAETGGSLRCLPPQCLWYSPRGGAVGVSEYTARDTHQPVTLSPPSLLPPTHRLPQLAMRHDGQDSGCSRAQTNLHNCIMKGFCTFCALLMSIQ
jgi:hypothetical protein